MSTYVPIQAITLSSAAADVTFTGIPQTFTDLVLVANGSTSTATNNILFRFNGDTGSNYSRTRVLGNGSSASSERQSNVTSMAIGDWGTDRCVVIANVQNYSNTTTNKTVLSRSSSEGFVSAYVGLWRNTSAISSITFFKASADFTSGSTFTLYGIGSGSPKAFGGDEVRTDGTYWYHIFRSSGRFEPVENLSCDYLVVAGGGGAGSNIGGGGGAGGYKESNFSLQSSTVYTVTVGGGGTGGAGGGANNGTNGINSSVSGTGITTVTSTGGGYGGKGGATSEAGANGGSGGGAGGYRAGYNGGTASPSGQGNNGGSGTGNSSSNGAAGGGGGSSAVGANGANTGVGGNGGNGTASSITGSSVTRAGGGGGGAYAGTGNSTGGTGGGGAGKNQTDAGGVGIAGDAGTANTGGGGGGGSAYNGAGGNGGSGIIVIRYGV